MNFCDASFVDPQKIKFKPIFFIVNEIDLDLHVFKTITITFFLYKSL
jgi:hypothetical protein